MNSRQVKPHISVLIPVYNGQRHLRETLQSVLVSTHPDFEVVVLDDGSSDASSEIVACIRDERVRLFRNPRNLGLAACRNRLLELARGDLVAWIDQDDLMSPQRLHLQSDYLDQHKDVQIVTCYSAFFSENFQKVVNWSTYRPPDRDATIRCKLIFRNCLDQSSIMMRKTVVASGVRHDSAHGEVTDYGFLLKIAETAKFACIPSVHSAWRVHEKGMSSGARQFDMALKAARLSFCHLHRALGFSPTEKIRLLHEAISLEPSSLGAAGARDAIAWLNDINQLNSSLGAYERRAFSDEIAFQKARILFFNLKSPGTWFLGFHWSEAEAAAQATGQRIRFWVNRARRKTPAWLREGAVSQKKRR